MAFIEIEDVTRRYDAEVTALDRVSLSIEAGEWLAVMGPSGSGKTTLMNLLGGLDQPESGRLLVDGLDLARLDRPGLIRYRREAVGLVFQQYHLIPYLSAVENVMLAQYLHSLADEAEAARALAEVGLSHRLRHLPSAMSGGERQRVCIARALINRPKLILADEPTGSLDEENERLVLELFQRMHDRGQTIVMVTHDLTVGQRADKQVQLEHGRVAGYHLTHAQREEDTDEVLEYLWLVEEGSEIPANVCARGRVLAATNRTERMREEGLVTLSDGGIPAFTPTGRRRAAGLIRRHRLAETLFTGTFQMPAAAVEEEACYFEHILSPTVTESICAFLGHPETCPHGQSIPPGLCCPPARLAAQHPATSVRG